jgi:hypothetical protein
VFENRVLRRILGPKRDEVTGEWRKLYNEELSYKLCSSKIIVRMKSRRDRLCGLVVRVLDYRTRDPGFDSLALQKK